MLVSVTTEETSTVLKATDSFGDKSDLVSWVQFEDYYMAKFNQLPVFYSVPDHSASLHKL